MTPEERFQKIENMLEALTEHQTKHSVDIDALTQMQKKHSEGMAELRQMHLSLGLAVMTTNKQVGELAEKVGSLADSVEKFLKGFPPPNGKH